MSGGQRALDPHTPLAPTATGLIQLQELRIGSVVAERFRIERILGMGGMGLVYLAHDLELGVDVALKQLRPELASRADAFERFRKELLLARSVSSPYVVRIHDLVRHEQTWLISMDYVAGRSLERLLQEEGVLEAPRALAIARQIALGLAAAHDSGVVHRDLKPANILIDAQDQARITDFGVARAAGDTGITGSGVVIGTPEYLSPEQARADVLDGRSDLYALGLILYEMLTGTLPFRGGTPAEMMIQRLVRSPPSADTVRPGLPPFAVALCSRLLALEPAQRLAHGEAVAAAIERGELERPPRPRWTGADRRRLLLWGLALLLALIAGGLLLRGYEQGAEQAPTLTMAGSRLDLLPLPWSVDSDRAEDRLAAQAAWYLLVQQLRQTTPLRVADQERVARVLRTLDFDASAADRQHERVMQVGAAAAVLEADWRRDEAGLSLHLRLVSAGAAEPGWQWRRDGLAESELPMALATMTNSLRQALGLPAAAAAAPWPSIDRLQGLGRWFDPQPSGRDGLQPQESPDAWSATEWRLWLQQLDRGGMKAQAAVAARQVLDRLAAGDSDTTAAVTRAYAALLVGAADQAEALLQQSAVEAGGDLPARRLLARAQAEQGRFDDAMQTLQRLLREDPGDGQAWFEQGKYALMAGDARRAVDELLVRAQVIGNRLQDDWLRADVANALGIGYRRLGQMDAAAVELERAIALRERLGDARGHAASLGNLSTVRLIQGDFDAARQALAQARTLIEPLGDATAMADLATDSGLLAEEEGDFEAALAAYREGLALRQALDDPRSTAESLLNVGFAYFQLGQFDNAQTYWAQARSHYAELDDQVGLVHSQESLGLAATARGDWSTARRELEAGLLTAESQQMDEEQANALAILAELERLQGHYAAALQRSGQAAQIFERRGDQRGRAEMALLQAQVLLDIGAAEAAASTLSALQQDPPGSAEQQAMLALRGAELALLRRDAAQALTQAGEALTLAGEARSAAVQLQAQLLLALAQQAAGMAEQALATLARVDAGLARHASVPLRLLLAETHLRIGSPQQEQQWQSAQALLARLPGYGRSWRLLTAAQARLGPGQQALHAAQLSSERDRIAAALPAELRSVFAAAFAESTTGVPDQ